MDTVSMVVQVDKAIYQKFRVQVMIDGRTVRSVITEFLKFYSEDDHGQNSKLPDSEKD